MVEIKQTWWHIEEIYYPSYARKIRHIMDIFTDKTEIPLYLNGNYVGLKIIARNASNREIAFLETIDKDNTSYIILNIAPLDSFPFVPKSFSKIENDTRRHIKLEIEYILTNPSIEILKETKLLEKIMGRIIPKKKGIIPIIGKIQPELSITIPAGWRICRKGTSVGMHCSNQENISTSPIIDFKDNGKCELKFEKPFINRNNIKQIYNYIIDKESYNKLKITKQNNTPIHYEFTYLSRMSLIIAGISLLPFIVFFPLSFVVFICGLKSLIYKTPFIFDTGFGIGYLVLVLSFLYFYYNLLRDQFYFPYKKSYFIIFFFTIFIIAIVFLQSVTDVRGFIEYFFK